MKKIICLLACTLSFLSYAQATIGNGKFDAPRLAPWQTSIMSGKFTFGIQDAEGANDGKALNITCTDDNGKGAASIWGRVYQKITVTNGTNYQLKIRYKTLPGFNGQLELWVRPGQRADDLRLPASEDWQEVTMTFAARGNEALLYLTVTKGTGTVLIDEVSIMPVVISNYDFTNPRLLPWYTSTPSGKFTYTLQRDDTAHNGKVLAISCTGDDGKGASKIWGRAYQEFKVTPGKKYVFKVRVKLLPGFQGRFEFWVRSGQGRDANRTMRAAAREDWQEIVGFFVAPADKATVYLTICGGVGSALVDEVIMEEAE